MIVTRKIVLPSTKWSSREGWGAFAYGLGGMIIRVLLGLCDSDDHADDVMIMIAGYYSL